MLPRPFPHPETSIFRRFRRAALLPALFPLLALLAGGCGRGSGGGGGDPPPAEPAKVVISGTVRNVSGQGAARLARDELPAVAEALVEVRADLDGDGLYGLDEIFATTADADGFFALTIPGVEQVARIALRVTRAGYSEFLKEYEGVRGTLVVGPSLSEGAFAAIDLSGVSAGPARAGRVTLETDEVVTLSLVRDRATGRRAARVGRGAEGAGGDELVRVAFPLRGLALPAGSQEIFASVAYLDTVNDTDVMPGGFRAEGEGQTPVDMLATYGASQIRLYDAKGRELLTDPNDRTTEVRIQMAIAPEAYVTIYDEDPATDEVEIPLYYYDEAAATWKLHKHEDGSAAYAVLQDNFGNRLRRSDLPLLQNVALGADGEFVPDPLYAPEGAVPSEVTIYGVGTVHHFTTWNCDRADRSTSYNLNIRGRGRNPPPETLVRLRKKQGGRNSDESRPDPKGRTNLHTDRDRTADSLIRKLLARGITPEERARLLWTIQNGDNPRAKQALIEALRRYAENLRDDIASGGDDFERGIRAIFNNKSINDAFINTDGLDCTRTPDLCNGVLGAAAETVNRSKDAQKAVAFLMEIAVDSYNPSNLDFTYAADKGIEFLDMVLRMDGVAQELKGLPEKVEAARELARTAKALRSQYFQGKADFSAYWDAANAFSQTMGDIKDLASSIGGRSGRAAPRAAAAAAPPAPAGPAEAEAILADLEQNLLYEYEEVGGLLLGASRFRRYTYAYWNEGELCVYVPDEGGTHAEVCLTDETRVAELRVPPDELEDAAARAGGRLLRRGVVLSDPHLTGGGEVGVLEFFDGYEWVPLPARSSLGVDPAFIPVPRSLSFGGGTRERPMLYLGDWELPTEPNVEVRGRVLVEGGSPARNARVYVAGQELQPGDSGLLSGRITAFTSLVRYQVAGSGGGWVPVSDGVADLGDVTVPDAVVWQPDLLGAFTTERNRELAIESPAQARSGAPLTYTFRLHRNYWYGAQAGVEPLDEQSGTSSTYTFDSLVFDGLGTYTLEVNARTDPEGASGVSATRLVRIAVVNVPPRVEAVTVAPAAPRVGDDVRLTVVAADDDGPDDVQASSVSVVCFDDAGREVWPWVVQDGPGWVIRTDNVRELYRWDAAGWSCRVSSWVRDRSWGYGRRDETFDLEARAVAPEVTWTGLSPEYTVAYGLQIVPAWTADFDDRNGDLLGYELDCGDGFTFASSEAITRPCAYAEPGDYAFVYRAVDRGGRAAEVRATIHYLYPLRIEVDVPPGLTPSPQAEGQPTLYELPATSSAGQVLRVTAVSDNGPQGYAEGGGTLVELRYTLTYQPAYSWRPRYLASYEEAQGGTVPITVDKPGTYHLTLSAQDDKGIWGTYGQTFLVTSPFDAELLINGLTARQFAASPRPWVVVDEEVFFDAQAAGPEGWSPEYLWKVGDTVVSTQKAPTIRFSQAGENRVRLEVRNAADPVDRSVVREMDVWVYGRPVAAFSSGYEPAVEGEVRAGDAFNVDLVFPEGQVVTAAEWSVWVQGPGGTWTVSTGYEVLDGESLASRSLRFSEAGVYQIRVSLVDERGIANELVWDLPVVVRKPPVVSLSPASALGRPPLQVSFAAVASDPDARTGEILVYQWFVDDVPVEGPGGASLVRTWEQEGASVVRVRVTDATGLWAEATASVTALYRPPVISQIEVDPGRGPAPLTVWFTASASDPDGTVVAYAWDATGDGVFEQQGPSPLFQHTYLEPGTYALRLRVTDNDGSTAERTRVVYVLDPDVQAVTFDFRELRSDGFGPPFDFSAQDEFIHDYRPRELAFAPPDDPNVRPEHLTPLAPSLSFAELGFYGAQMWIWGSPATSLFQVVGAGDYTVGLYAPGGLLEARTVQFPDAYTCGYLLYGDGASLSFGLYVPESRTSTDLYPPPASRTVAEEVKVLALLGTELAVNESPNRCVPSYAGFVAGSGETLALDAAAQVPLKPLGAPPEGYVLQIVDVDVGDGVVYHMWNSELDQDEEGRYRLPVVPGAGYLLRYLRTLEGTHWEVAFRVSAAEAAAGDEILVDFAGVAERTDLVVANGAPFDLLELALETPAVRIRGTVHLSGAGPQALGPVPVPAAPEATAALHYVGENAGLGFARRVPAGELGPVVDLAAPGVATEVEKLELAVDEGAKTLTVDFGATTGDACVVTVDADYEDPGLPQYGYRDRTWSFLTDGSQAAYVLEYPIPESSVALFGDDPLLIPAIDALTRVTAAVSCGRTDLGYEGLLREILAEGEIFGYDPLSAGADRLLTDVLRRWARWERP